MMKHNCRGLVIVLSLLVLAAGTTFPNSARAQMDPKVKALALMATYGTIGGALLGTASLAFGMSSRSIARGASLGLYAGLIFGSVVVVSHAAKKRGWAKDIEYYPEAPEGPYERGFDSGEAGPEETEEQAWRYKIPDTYSYGESDRYNSNIFEKRAKQVPIFYINLLNVAF